MVKSNNRWWENGNNSGYRVYIKGTETQIECPKCSDAYIVYNGNYFCAEYDNTCDWALPHPVRTKKDKNICDLIGIDYG